MTATKAIETLSGLTGGLREKLDELDRVAVREQAAWDRLKQVGGARDDHAAAMLVNVQRELASILVYVGRCREQLAEAICNPFGDERPAEKLSCEFCPIGGGGCSVCEPQCHKA